MVRGRWPTGSRGPEPRRKQRAVAAALAALTLTSAARADVEVAPGPGGGLGALLVAGPVAGVKLGVALGGPGPKASWQLGAAPSATFDLRAMLDTKGSEATALAFGVLRVKRAFRGFLLLSVDDGVTVHLDGKPVFARDD